MAEAEANANGPMFKLSARMRAFARAMGDDMLTSTAGYADAAGAVMNSADPDTGGEILMSGF